MLEPLAQLLAYYPNVLNLRVIYPITRDMSDKRGLVGKLAGFSKVDDAVGCCTFLEDLCPLVPLMMICGPEGTQGDVTHLLRCRAVVKAEPKVVDETVGSTPPRTPANTLCLVTAPSASVEASNAASGGACSPGGAADEATEGAA